MSNIKMAGFQSNLFEELDDADLVAVTGGGTLDILLGTATGANNAIGNGGRPTTGAVTLVSNTLRGGADYIDQVNGGLEGGFQVINGGLTDTGNSL
jgi:broad specificity phosphatase PhoE